MADLPTEALASKVDRLCSLMALVLLEGKTLKQKAALLERVGYSPKEIAAFAGTTPNTVRVTLSNLRNKKTPRKKA